MKNLDNNLPNGQINQSDQSAFNSTENNPALAEMPDVLSGNDIAEYPTIIRRIITEYAETIQERSQAHRILTEMPQGNSQAFKTRRTVKALTGSKPSQFVWNTFSTSGSNLRKMVLAPPRTKFGQHQRSCRKQLYLKIRKNCGK